MGLLLRKALAIAGGLAAAILAWWLVHLYIHRPEAPVGLPVVATEARPASGAPIEGIIPLKPIKVRTGEKVKRALHLDPIVVTNPEIVVVAASELKGGDERPRVVTTTLNKATGALETTEVRGNLPWFEFRSNGSVGTYAGVSNEGHAAMLQAKQSVFKVKNVEFGFIGTVIQPTNPGVGLSGTQFFGGFGAEVKW